MHPRLCPLILSILLTIGLVLPKMGAVIVEFVPGVYSAVICTGSGMEVITIGKDGQPIEQADFSVGECVGSDVHLSSGAKSDFWIKLAKNYEFAFIPVLNPAPSPHRAQIRRLPQGPPVSV